MTSTADRRPRSVATQKGWATIVLIAPSGSELQSWRLAGDGPPDLEVVDVLARAALIARRRGCSIRLRGACDELLKLLDLAGLRVEVFGQAECGEQVRIEEVVVTNDPVV
jgi:hypothetical protein